MSLKTGSKAFLFPANTQVTIKSEQKDFSVYTVNDDGEPEDFLAISSNGILKFRTIDAVDGFVNVENNMHWSIDLVPLSSPYETHDPVPVEVPEDKRVPESLQSKLERMLAGMVAERYGKDSREMETFEESMDFDIDDDDDPVARSGYEVSELIDDFPDVGLSPDPDPQLPPAEPSEGKDAEASTGSTPDSTP
jgi:hypothetical protein